MTKSRFHYVEFSTGLRDRSVSLITSSNGPFGGDESISDDRMSNDLRLVNVWKEGLAVVRRSERHSGQCTLRVNEEDLEA